jgi:hypothetical protein
MSDIDIHELVIQHDELKEKHAALEAEHLLLQRVHSNYTGAINQLQSQMEQLYADASPGLTQNQQMHWRAHLGLPVMMLAREYRSFGFATALLLIAAGRRVQRAGWNGKGMWVTVVTHWSAQLDVSGEDGLQLHPWLVMKTADQALVPWLVSQTDLLASDWQLYQPPPVQPVEEVPKEQLQ